MTASYIRDDDGAEMIELRWHQFVNAAVALALGLSARGVNTPPTPPAAERGLPARQPDRKAVRS